MASFLGVLDPGDGVVLFEPFYEAYGPDSILDRRRPAVRDAPALPTGRSIPTNSAPRSPASARSC